MLPLTPFADRPSTSRVGMLSGTRKDFWNEHGPLLSDDRYHTFDVFLTSLALLPANMVTRDHLGFFMVLGVSTSTSVTSVSCLLCL